MQKCSTGETMYISAFVFAKWKGAFFFLSWSAWRAHISLCIEALGKPICILAWRFYFSYFPNFTCLLPFCNVCFPSPHQDQFLFFLSGNSDLSVCVRGTDYGTRSQMPAMGKREASHFLVTKVQCTKYLKPRFMSGS